MPGCKPESHLSDGYVLAAALVILVVASLPVGPALATPLTWTTLRTFSVPIAVTTSPNDPAFTGSWALKFYNLSVSYSQGDPLNRAPTFSGQIQPISVTAGGSNRSAVDLASYFSDPDGDLLTYCGKV